MTIYQCGRYRVETSREEKVLFDRTRVSKGDMIRYYRKVAGVMLPHLKDRPLMLQRFPDGIHQSGFYQKNVSKYFPDWIRRTTVAKKEGTVTHPLCNNTASLVFLADQACITFHSWLSRSDRLNLPDRMIFDLDPAAGDFDTVRNAALRLRDILNRLELPSHVMTTGSRGVHVIVPLLRKDGFDSVRQTAREIAGILVQRYPDDYTLEVAVDKRRQRLFIDTNRNAYAQTAVAPYSLRPKPQCPVATPLQWHELTKSSLSADSYTISNIFHRLGAVDDPWRDTKRNLRTLKKARDILGRKYT